MRLIVEHRTPYVREAAANSLATALPSKPDLFDVYLDKFVNLYHDKVHPPYIVAHLVGKACAAKV